MINKAKKLVTQLFAQFNQTAEQDQEQEPEEIVEELCCNGKVHIAYRGLADDRLYIIYDRQWQEVKFYRQNGLKVFCADCRRHVY